MRLRATALPALLTVLLSMACQSDETPPADARAASAGTAADRAPPLQAMNAFYYYDDVDRAWAFYTEILGFRTVVDYGFAKILRVAESSPIELLPLGVPQHLVSGARDPIVPEAFGRAYSQAAREAGDDAALTVIPDAGHFELISPSTAAWQQVNEAIWEILE